MCKDRAACTLSWDGHVLNPTKNTTNPYSGVLIFNYASVYPCHLDLWCRFQFNWTMEVKLIWSFSTSHAIGDTITERVRRKKVSSATSTLPDAGFILFIQLSSSSTIWSTNLWSPLIMQSKMNSQVWTGPSLQNPNTSLFVFCLLSSGDETRANCLNNIAHRIIASLIFYCIPCHPSYSNWISLVLMSHPSAPCQGCRDVTGPVWGNETLLLHRLTNNAELVSEGMQ